MKKTNKIKVLLVLLLLGMMMTLCGCSLENVISQFSPGSKNQAEQNVETLQGWHFQYNDETQDYSLRFSLLDKDENAIAASGIADIRIEDEEGNVLFSGKKAFTKNDFGTYTTESFGERYLVNIRIQESELKKGTSSSGTVYLTVYKSGYYHFDEASCSALNCLPVKNEYQSEKKVEILKNWQFQHNNGTRDYSIFFSLNDKNDHALSASGTVDVRIEDEEGHVLYIGKKTFTKEDFGTYTSESKGEQYLVNIRLKESELKKGTSSSGTVYLTVYNPDYYRFDEVNCSALYCLPVQDITVSSEALPKEISVYSSYSGLQARLKINKISYETDNSLGSSLTITVIGEKTYGKNNSGYDWISYKIYDREGYVVDSGTIMLNSLSAGEKFKENTHTFYDAKPGEHYTIKFYDYQF